MNFTEGKWREYERLMKETPGFDRGKGIQDDHSSSCNKRQVKEEVIVSKRK